MRTKFDIYFLLEKLLFGKNYQVEMCLKGGNQKKKVDIYILHSSCKYNNQTQIYFAKFNNTISDNVVLAIKVGTQFKIKPN